MITVLLDVLEEGKESVEGEEAVAKHVFELVEVVIWARLEREFRLYSMEKNATHKAGNWSVAMKPLSCHCGMEDLVPRLRYPGSREKPRDLGLELGLSSDILWVVVQGFGDVGDW
jgi:hypothetical protein